MRYLADECFDRRVAEALRAGGADVVFAADEAAGARDEDVLASALAGGRILLTKDKDFGTLVFNDGSRAKGVVLLRIDGLSALMSSRSPHASLPCRTSAAGRLRRWMRTA